MALLVFETEKRVYHEEGLNPGEINFTDNAAVLEMVSGYNPHDLKRGVPSAEIKRKIKRSLFGILDDVCKQEKNTGVTYCEQDTSEWRGEVDDNGPLFEGSKFGAEVFTIHHFAGAVEYGLTEVDKQQFLPPSQWARAGIDSNCAKIDSFVTKNKDKVPQSLLDFFGAHAQNSYYLHCAELAAQKTAFDEEPSPAAGRRGGGSPSPSSPNGGSKGRSKTIVGKFNLEIEAFFSQLLTGADPKFIRTINPRPKGIPAPPTMGQRFNLQRVLGQLRYTGILDTVRVRASGYIIRKRYEEFAPAYISPCNLLPEDNTVQGSMDDESFARRVREDPQVSLSALNAGPTTDLDKGWLACFSSREK